MKKYNLSEIMKAAWGMYNELKATGERRASLFSRCLKAAWADFKHAMTKTNNAVQTLPVSFETISKISKNSYGFVEATGNTVKVETVSIDGRGFCSRRYKDTVLEATSDNNGNVTFSYATPVSAYKTAKTNKTNELTFVVPAGAVNGVVFNIDWSKVNSVSGETYTIKHAAKEAGLKWDNENKIWRR